MLEFLGFGKTKHDASDTAFSTRTLSGLAHGIAPHWLAAELLPVSSPQEPDAWIIQIAVLQWHTGFGQYLVALQKEFLDSLKRIEHGPQHHHYTVHWVYAPDCGCPYTTLPSAAFWSVPADREEEEEDDDNGFAATVMREDK